MNEQQPLLKYLHDVSLPKLESLCQQALDERTERKFQEQAWTEV